LVVGPGGEKKSYTDMGGERGGPQGELQKKRTGKRVLDFYTKAWAFFQTTGNTGPAKIEEKGGYKSGFLRKKKRKKSLRTKKRAKGTKYVKANTIGGRVRGLGSYK